MCRSTNRALMITVLVIVCIIFALNFVITGTAVYHRENSAVTFGNGLNTVLMGSARNVYIGMFRSVIEFDGFVSDVTVDTVDFWVLFATACDHSAMEDQTRALQGFWVISQICCLVLLIVTSIKVCCKQDLSHWFTFGANIFVFVSIIIVSCVIGYQHNFDFCPGGTLNDLNYDLSGASFLLFVIAALLFVSQILACLASCCYKDDEPEKTVVVVETHPDQV